MAETPRIIMSQLGRKGRWGNQVFEYMFLRAYAFRYDLEYQAPRWVGQQLFGLDDPPITDSLPTFEERRVPTKYEDVLGPPQPPDGMEAVGHDYNGYAQFHTSYFAAYQPYLRGLFQPKEEIEARLMPAVDKLHQMGDTIVGLHMRRGDTGRLIFYLTPNEWYRTWLAENWGRLENPVLFIASEDSADAEAFADYNPVTATSLGIDLQLEPMPVFNYLRRDLANPTAVTMDWFPDWWLLTQCDVLVFGESTYSFSAAMMGHPREAWRSKLSLQRFVPVDPWYGYPLVREDLRDYPGIPGTENKNNLYYQRGEGCEVPGRD